MSLRGDGTCFRSAACESYKRPGRELFKSYVNPRNCLRGFDIAIAIGILTGTFGKIIKCAPCEFPVIFADGRLEGEAAVFTQRPRTISEE